MSDTLLVIQIVLFGLALALGINLLARARGQSPVLLPGVTLLSFALFVGFDALANYLDVPDTRFFLSLLSIVLLVLTLVLAVGALLALQRREMLPAWRYATYAAVVLVAAGAAGLLQSADIAVRIAAVVAAGVGVLLLGLAARAKAPATS
jgi:hypothetical protein